MAVEKMFLMNVVGDLKDVDAFTEDVLKIDAISPVDAFSQIENNSFIFKVTDSNLERTVDFNRITTFEKDEKIEALKRKARGLLENLDMQDAQEGVELLSPEHIDNVYRDISALLDAKQETREKKDVAESYVQGLKFLDTEDVDLKDLNTLEFFGFRFGKVVEEGRLRLKKNYENVPAVVFHLGSYAKEEVYLFVFPEKIKDEIDRILKSLSFVDMPLPDDQDMTTREALAHYEQEVQKGEKELEAIDEKMLEYRGKHEKTLKNMVYTVDMLESIDQMKGYMARSTKFFYMVGWVPESKLGDVKQALSKYDDAMMNYKPAEDVAIEPPTKLKNHSLFRPFEALVHMYGTPNYNELDPTPFFAITYTLLFGMMFGDLGQGAVFFLAGLLLRKKAEAYGGILTRIGLSSMIFGVLYGSVFGAEDLIPALLIKPFDNIQTVLIASIIFGIGLTSCAYLLSIYNRLIKNKNLEEGLFGKEGVAGFLLFLGFILFIGTFVDIHILPGWLIGCIMLISILMILLKQPLARLVEHKRPLYDEGAGSYYLEGSFSMIEALLSIFSGTVSFIRVGAFAINHVGLFLAFSTMAEMAGGGTFSWIILILGNLLIIGLEGLIVLIQGLRLEYYELFSKYYTGDGVLYTPIRKTKNSIL